MLLSIIYTSTILHITLHYSTVPLLLYLVTQKKNEITVIIFYFPFFFAVSTIYLGLPGFSSSYTAKSASLFSIKIDF